MKAKSEHNTVKRNERSKYTSKEKHNLSKLSKTMARMFWQRIKSQYRKQDTTSTNIDIDELHEQFKSLYNTGHHNQQQQQNHQLHHTHEEQEPHQQHQQHHRQQQSHQPNDIDNGNVFDDILDGGISYTELKDAVFSHNNNKNSGIDPIVAEIYKCSFDTTSPFMLTIFNTIYHSGIYAESLGSGVIVPIFKGRDSDNAKNYRGITLINTIAKIHSQILLNRLTRWFTNPRNTER